MSGNPYDDPLFGAAPNPYDDPDYGSETADDGQAKSAPTVDLAVGEEQAELSEVDGEGEVSGTQPVGSAEPENRDGFDATYTRLAGHRVTVEIPIEGGKTAKVTYDAQQVMLDLDRRAAALDVVWERCK